jgi:hypothetical protein
MDAPRYSGNSDRERARRRQLLFSAKTPDQRFHAKTRIARDLIDPGRLQDEPDLQQSCFFAYRYMDPYRRTQVFADHFAYMRAILAKKRGLRLSDRALSIAMEDERTFSAMWAARQEFDRLGLDYRKPMLWVIKRAHEARHKYLPRPNQIFTSAAIAEVLDMWTKHGWWEVSMFDAIEPVEPEDPDELDADGFPVEIKPYDPAPPLDPRFLAVNYVGSPQQRSALDDLETYVRHGKAGLATNRLALVLHRARLISKAEAIARFGEELVENAKPGPGYVVEPEVLPAAKNIQMPQCFGHGPVAGNQNCEACPVAGACATLFAKVTAELLAAYGSADPRAVRKREQNRKHQAASRARKKGNPDSGNPGPEGSTEG